MTKQQPPFTSVIADLPSSVPFVGPEALERQRGTKFKARIGANESVFGPSPKAIAAMREAAADGWMYGDPELHELKAALARHHDVKPENIAVGEGIDGLFGYTVRLFVEPRVKVATSLGAYPTFNFHVAGCGGELVTTPYRADREDPESLLALARRAGARLLFLANPDNPMGSWTEALHIKALIDRLPGGTLACLDEAYIDFAPPETAPPIDIDNPQVLRFRTFSKAHGLAGIRVGYVIGERGLIKSFDKIRNHFGVGRLAQAAALAALADREHLASVVARVGQARERIGTIARASGLKPLPSATNFVAVDCGRDGDFARRVLVELASRGVFVRMPGVAPLNRCIRISAGTDADLDLLATALPEALKAALQHSG
jgi:histidinol-phosphate aminotransferase